MCTIYIFFLISINLNAEKKVVFIHCYFTLPLEGLNYDQMEACIEAILIAEKVITKQKNIIVKSIHNLL